MGSAGSAWPRAQDGLDGQLAALYRRLCARPLPVHLLDLVEQLEAACPGTVGEPVLDQA